MRPGTSRFRGIPVTGPQKPSIGAPRWPRNTWISPSVLNNYVTCPYRVRLQNVDRVPQPWQFWPHLAKGRIAHLALKRIADALARNQHPVDEAEVLKMTLLHLPHQFFPSPEAYQASVQDIVRWVDYGRRYIERIPDPRWLLIEKNQSREWPIFPNQSPYTLMARPDVVIQRSDEDGNPLIEIIDYKTGAIRPEEDPPVIMRFVARDLLRQTTGNASKTRVRFTYLWLDHADKTEIDLSVDYCNDHWPELTQRVHNLASETEWTATPSWLCRYCPYHRNACQESIPHEG